MVPYAIMLDDKQYQKSTKKRLDYYKIIVVYI